MKKTRVLLCVVLALCMLIVSCDNGGNVADTTAAQDSTAAEAQTTAGDDGITLTADGKSDYTVVRPDSTSSTVIDAMNAIINGIKAKTDVRLVAKTDWLNDRAGEVAPDCEILVGETCREESAIVKAKLSDEYDYRIEIIGKKLVIIGGGDVATLRAAEYFAASLLNDDMKYAEGMLYSGRCSDEDMHITLDGETSATIKELYKGVKSTHYSLSAASKYGLQELTVVEFDPKQSDLYFDVTMGGAYATTLKTVTSTVKTFAQNNSGKTPIVAINGDLWMVSYAHARILGGSTSYKGYTDYVVTKSLTVPRGFNMYGGEIITSAHIEKETPYEGAFYSFGITDDGVAVLGNPQVALAVKNTTQGTSTSADGLNRLPANNALIMYTDKLSNNYSMDDAYEIIIDCGYDYTVCHGATITGRITAITKPGETKQAFKANRIILTARGSRVDSVSGYSVGDSIEISVSVSDKMGNSAIWQSMKNAVGGHIPVIVDGKSRNSSDSTKYPMSVLGIKSDGKVIMLTNDGRQSGYSVGIMISQLDELCADLGIVTAFILDGGGSAEMVDCTGGSYTVVNRPSDGKERAVVNTVILSYGPKKN